MQVYCVIADLSSVHRGRYNNGKTVWHCKKFSVLSYLPTEQPLACYGVSWTVHLSMWTRPVLNNIFIHMAVSLNLWSRLFLIAVHRAEGCNLSLIYIHKICKECWVNSHSGCFECLARLHGLFSFKYESCNTKHYSCILPYCTFSFQALQTQQQLCNNVWCLIQSG